MFIGWFIPSQVTFKYIKFKMENMNPFLVRNKEKSDLNQYWYSKATINFMVSECEVYGKRIAFLSTPSVFFTLKD